MHQRLTIQAKEAAYEQLFTMFSGLVDSNKSVARHYMKQVLQDELPPLFATTLVPCDDQQKSRLQGFVAYCSTIKAHDSRYYSELVIRFSDKTSTTKDPVQKVDIALEA